MKDNTGGSSSRGTRLFAWLALAAVLVVAIGIIITQEGSQPVPVRAAEHPQVAEGATCTSCKAPKHQYVHSEPYQGECDRCHVVRSWARVTYQHAAVEFNTGFHEVVGCAFCHTKGNTPPSADCGSCHESEHRKTTGCSKCHQATAWRLPGPLPKRHVSLANGHSTLTCFECHRGATAFSDPKTCVECHGSKHGGLTDCGSCHDPALDGWWPKNGFDHSRFFILSGRHKKVQCRQCHPNNNFAAARPDCRSCHGSKHGGLTDCAACHTTSGFLPSTFRHSRVFLLSGKHAKLACTACHPGRRYAFAIGSPGSCSSCHEPQHGGLTDCGSCHTTASFSPSTFRHASAYRLTGRHASLRCSQCHPGGLFARVVGDKRWCVSCHGKRHGGLTRCGACHTTAEFTPSTFRHASRWSLAGKHASTQCTKCHPNARYANVIGSPARCTNCHGVKHGNQVSCETCHTTKGFSPAKQIAHPVEPALGGEHASRPCTLCHPQLVFSDEPRACESCHDAPHVSPTDCLRCHRPTTWSQVAFVHDDVGYHTQFPIEEACLMCHTTGNYSEYVCDQCHWPYD